VDSTPDDGSAQALDPLLLRAQMRVGTTVRSKWRLDLLLGVGGMATVYAATHRNGSRAAVKILHAELSINAQLRGRFLREGYLANAVGHHGAVKVIDDDIAEDGSLFLVTELLDGETLQDRLVSELRLRSITTRGAAKQVFTRTLRDLFGIPRPYDLSFADPLHVVPAANRFRDVSFVLPHFGGGLLQNALLAGAQCENVLLDTSSSNDWMATLPSRPALADVFRSALGVFGAERLLFGTDSSTFPRGWRADIRDAQLAALEQAGAKAAQIEAVMGGNLARLLPSSV